MKHQKTIEQNVVKFIEKNKLLSDSKKILIGLSGGPDSVFVLHFFLKYSGKFNIKIAAVHIDHSLRGIESKMDAEFCNDLCKSWGIEFYSVKINTKSHAKKFHKSIEEAARDLRYEEFKNVAKLCNADLIVTGHNIDDNTETVLLNLFRGTGINGISGIPIKRGNIIRPILSVSKEEITNYLKISKIKYVIDRSNSNVDFRRNYLRKKIVPSLKKNFNKSLDKVIFQSSKIMKDQSKILDFYISSAIKKIVNETEDGIIILISELREYPEESYGEIFKKVYERYFTGSFSYEKAEKLKTLINSRVGTKVILNKTIHSVRERGKLFIYKYASEKKISFTIKVGEKISIGKKTVKIGKIKNLPKKFNSNPSVEYISGDGIGGKMNLRPWKFGDKIQLLGMDGTKKISDVLTDLKIPPSERKKKYVLEYKKDIVWLVGYRINEKYKITNYTKNIIKLCLS